MKAEEYKEKIVADMKAIETYKPEFDKTIEALAKIYVDMDNARSQFEASGGNMIVAHVNKGGNKNLVKNPFYVIIEILQANILLYNRELGLTPKGLKQINDKTMNTKKKKSKLDSALEAALSG